MSDNNKKISDEAVEAATAALLKAWGYGTRTDSGTSADMRIALEAAAPHIAAQAWDEGWFAEGWQTNPYRSQA